MKKNLCLAIYRNIDVQVVEPTQSNGPSVAAPLMFVHSNFIYDAHYHIHILISNFLQNKWLCIPPPIPLPHRTAIPSSIISREDHDDDDGDE